MTFFEIIGALKFFMKNSVIFNALGTKIGEFLGFWGEFFTKIIVMEGAEFKGSGLLKGWRYGDCTRFLEKFSLLNSRMKLGFFMKYFVKKAFWPSILKISIRSIVFFAKKRGFSVKKEILRWIFDGKSAFWTRFSVFFRIFMFIFWIFHKNRWKRGGKLRFCEGFV